MISKIFLKEVQMNKKTNSINIFEIISRINDDFGNLVYIAKSFPSVDVKLASEHDKNIITIKTYNSYYPEDDNTVGVLKIEWNDKDTKPVYHLIYEQDVNNPNRSEIQTSDFDTIVSEIFETINPDDEPTEDEDPNSWESGMFPVDYYNHCFRMRTGIFEGTNSDTKLEMPWF